MVGSGASARACGGSWARLFPDFSDMDKWRTGDKKFRLGDGGDSESLRYAKLDARLTSRYEDSSAQSDIRVDIIMVGIPLLIAYKTLMGWMRVIDFHRNVMAAQ